MNTLYFNANSDFIPTCSDIIRAGGLVAFPTETVYGLGANGLDGNAVNGIFKAKGRPNDNPLILHIADKEMLFSLWESVPSAALKLIDAFWPGPLTLIYKKSARVPNEVTASLDTVAVRMPRHEIALKLIKEAGVPLAAPSANISSRPSPTSFEHVLHDMDGRIDAIIDGGKCACGVESTVLSLVDTPTILRPGAITPSMLESVIGKVEIASAVLSPLRCDEKVLSPGLKYKHYAPDAEVIIASGSPQQASQKIKTLFDEYTSSGKKCIIFSTLSSLPFYEGLPCVTIGDSENPITMCANLFSLLREHGSKYDCILTEAIKSNDEGLAYMNRLLRASGFKIV